MALNPLDYAKQICYSSEETLMFTYEMAKKYADVPGCYVECGVAAGAQIIAMAYGAPNKTIYAFDSFQGIPLPSNEDDQIPGIRKLTESERKELPAPGKQKLGSSGATVVSEDEFWNNIIKSRVEYGSGNIKTVPGWFEETIPSKHPFQNIAILRLDGDLYNSTLHCLQWLYPGVIKGGIIIIDDYKLPGCWKAVCDYFGNTSNNELRNFQFSHGVAYFEKEHSTIKTTYEGETHYL